MFKKVGAVLLAVVMAFSMTACSSKDTAWVMEVDGEQLPAGVYLGYMVDAFSQAYNHEDVKIEKPKDIWNQKIDDKDIETWVKDKTKDFCKQYIAINKWFDELKLTLDESDKNKIDTQVSSVWSQMGSLYEENGAGQKSVRKIVESSFKSQKIFKSLYGVGGSEGVTQENVDNFFYENYAFVKMISLPTKGFDGSDLSEAQKKEVTEAGNKLVERVTGGESMDDVITAYKTEYTNKRNEYLASKDTTSSFTATPFSEDKEDKERNDVLLYKESTSYGEEVMKDIFAMEKDAIKLLTSDKGTFVVQKLDIKDKSDQIKDYTDSILNHMKGDEFTDLLEKRTADVQPTYNEKAIKRYSPKNIDVEG